MPVHQLLAEWSSWAWPLLANHLWQATLLSIVAFAAVAALRQGPGRARYAVWLLASAKFALPSALFAAIAQRLGIDFANLLTANTGRGDAAAMIYQLSAPITQLPEPASGSTEAVHGHNELFCALTVVWLIGCIALLAVWWRRRRRIRTATAVTPVLRTDRERKALDRVRTWLGIKRDVRLCILPRTIEPGVWGIWRPVVLLPESMADELSDAELEAVMMHEMIHVTRWDNLIANLHRLLCCLFWFHPIVWLLDRLLLIERERVCDEAVIDIGGARDVYASSLVKVLRFCLGWNVAGTSNATGSNLGRRVERIMSTNVQVKLSAWHRAVVGAIAALVIILSIAAGLVNRQGVAAQNKKPREAVGVPGGIPGSISGDTAFTFYVDQDKLIERIDQAPEVSVEFKNSSKAPLVITEARVRAVPRVEGPGDEYAAIPVVTLSNNSDRQIRGFTLELRNGLERRAYFERVLPPIDPHGTYISGRQRRFIILPGGPSAWSVRVAGVAFEDGSVWGSVPPPPPPPPPPLEAKNFDQAPENALAFNNRDDAPLSITGGSVKAVKLERKGAAGDRSNATEDEGYLIRLTADLVNVTNRRITGLAVGFGDGDSSTITFAIVSIDPHGSYKLGAPRTDGPSYGLMKWRGDPYKIALRVVGVKFEDGEVWGSFPPFPPPPPPPPPPVLGESQDPDSSKIIRKAGGVLMSSATHRVEADYPPLARAARITGTVIVEVTIDEGGSVIAARAISGHPLLKDAAVTAARQWGFSPTTLSGVPVKVIGTLTFNFQP